MQPNFTKRSFGYFCSRIIAVALIFTATTQFSFSQQKRSNSPQEKPGYENTLNFFQKQQLQQAKAGIKDNDAGLPNSRVVAPPRNSPEAICTTWTVSITGADPTTTQRGFRDGVPKTCAAPGTCTAGLNGSFNYQIFQWLCPVAQCVTVTYTATNASFGFVTVHNAPPTLGNTCANWVADPGSSGTSGVPIVFSFNGTAGTTYYFMVTNIGAPPSNCTIQIDAGVCFAAPCAGTPAPGNTIATPNPVGAGAPFTLSVQNNPPASGFTYDWQSATAVGGPYTTISGGPVPASTFVTSQVVARYYQCVVRCTASGLSATSTPVQVNLLACGWSASTVSPVSILDQGIVAIGSTLYSFAGVGGGAVIATSNKFDEATSTWSPIAPTPQPLEYPGVCTDGVNCYIAGGASSTGVSLTTFYRYNVASNTYTTLAPFTTGVWNPSLVFLNGKIYKFCGTAAASTAVMEVYDVATNTWSPGTPYPVALSFVSAIASGGKIYACGGVNTAGLAASSATYEFDPGTNAWTLKAPMAAQHWGHAGSFYNNGFAVAGGYINGATTIGTNAELYNIGSNTWGPLPNLPIATARVGGASTGLGGSFYVVGGRTLASAGFNGSTQNQKLFCIPPTPCSGAPAPGNTIASTNPVCSGFAFTLSLANNPFQSGFTYQWQSGPSATGPWTNLPGTSTNITYSGSQTGATWYRCLVTCTPSAQTTPSNPVLVADGQGIFVTQPVSTTTQCSGSASFSYTATGNSLTYAWEYRTSPTGFWFNLGATLNGATVTGITTSSITLSNVPQSLNGYQFRGTIIGPCTAIDFSNIVTLTVTPLIATLNVASPVTICTGTVVPLTLTNASSPATTTFASGPISIQIPDLIGPPASSPAVTDAGINHTIPVVLPLGSAITRIDVRVNITHTYASDLKLVLKNTTTNQVLNLFYHKSGAQTAGANFTNTVISSAGTTRFSAVAPPFTGTFRADWEIGAGSYGDASGSGPTAFPPTTQSWNTLWGGVDQGTGSWILAINDCQEWAGDIGTLTSWSMDITYGAPAAGTWTQTSPATPNSMFTDPAGTIPYAGGLANTIYVKPLATAPFTGNSATYCVVYSTATPACTSNPTCVTVNVTSPITGLTAPANRTVCVGTNASFSVTPGGGPLTYQWEVSVNSGLTWSPIAGATAATLNLTAVTQLMNNNLYRVTVNAAPCGAVTTAAARLNVNQLPVVTISSSTLQLVPGRIATLTGTSSPAPFSATSWSWTRNGTTIAGVTGNSTTANIDQQGDYRATVTDINGCVNSSNIVTIGSEASDNLWIYPNPNGGQFQVRLYYSGVQAERRKVIIYNAAGQFVAQKEFDLDSNTPRYLSMAFDLPLLAAGNYAVQVVDKYGARKTSGIMVIQ